MGVPGFFSWLIKNKKKLGAKNLIISKPDTKIKWLMLDTNCLLHPCVANILEKYKEGMLEINETMYLRTQVEEHIWKKITSTINDMIEQIKPEYLYVAIDGVAPMGKILQQRQRRYRFLFDKKIKINTNPSSTNELEDIITRTILKKNGIEEPILPLSSIELTPGTDYMERIHIKMKKYMECLGKQGIKYIYSSYHDEGEGEHKILQYIKKNLTQSDSIVIYGLDADLLFLSLGIGSEYDLYVMREKQVFSNKEVDLDEVPEYNFVEIKELHKLISNLEISTNDFIVLCYLIGNDFLPGLLTTDVKKGGLDKIFRAWNNLKEKQGIVTEYDNEGFANSYLVSYENVKGKKIYKTNLDLLKGLFEELVWTEKHIWSNINRDKYINQDNMEADEIEKLAFAKQEEKKNLMEKFINGSSSNIDCLDKIEFSSCVEYYSYYLGINCINIDKIIIKKMVDDYLDGINWCMRYYLDTCPSWTWGYNFMITPSIRDIINFFPNTSKSFQIKYIPRSLKPVEQLALAIPPQTYKYVIEKDIINSIVSNKKIGYMFPESFELDVNKEHIFWKCQVKIPIVEYQEYYDEIIKINIDNDKNKIYGTDKNF
jgi:5'-3' exonuclease